MDDQPGAEKPRSTTDDRQFFLVWSPQGGDPVRKIPTFDEARRSALNLSRRHPGQDFYVLRSCWRRLAHPPDVRTTGGETRVDRGETGEAGRSDMPPPGPPEQVN
jgi:hypothetical protein